MSASVGEKPDDLDEYEVGIIMRFWAEDGRHAIAQFVDAVTAGQPPDLDEVEAAVNHLENISQMSETPSS